MRKDEILELYPNIDKIKKTINWKPKVDFNSGLKKTIKYYKKNSLTINIKKYIMIGIVVGTRPELIKIYPVVKIFKRKRIKYKIIHTGQHYSGNLSKIFLKDFKILNPNYNLNIGSKPHGEQTAFMMIGLEKLILKNSFKAILVYGDTNSALAATLVTSKFNNLRSNTFRGRA